MSTKKTFVPAFPDLQQLRHETRSLMKRIGLTQTEIAKKLDVHQPDVARILELQQKYYKDFVSAYSFLAEVLNIIIDSSLGNDVRKLPGFCGVVVNGTEVYPVFDPRTTPPSHEYMPTKRVR